MEETVQPKLLALSKVAKFRALRKEKKPRRRTTKPARFRIADAFDYFTVPGSAGELGEGALNNERCVRAVAYLLHFSSENGNRDIDGSEAQGLGLVLEHCAGRIALVEGRRKWLREHPQEERQGQ